MKKYRQVTVLFTIVGLMACNLANKQSKNPSQDKFASFPAYFNQQYDQLRKGDFTLFKTVTLNGQKDTATISGRDSAAVHDLLKPFMEIDLNKPSLREEYDTSSLYDPFSGRKSVIYKSRGNQNNPSEITMELDRQGNIQQISIHSYTSNLVYEFRQDLFYQQNRQVRMTTYQKIAFLSPKELEVNVTIAPKTGM
ncbi:hypothetical protein FHW36_101909 [Chitinophaga polysaccharea]|uniref:Lipoprotein n=1 Tax=Chitinophaga polysaccharea TaxID=1293035 RepID=A0A561Q3P1_9BACT|nr:hypothetical protein [Chitinophaga polysaccharea]TWF44983.1 hypothetical protein FHW36_101909 [Chitinophaga polysaccharea]